jgi:hypothetical protein
MSFSSLLFLLLVVHILKMSSPSLAVELSNKTHRRNRKIFESASFAIFNPLFLAVLHCLFLLLLFFLCPFFSIFFFLLLLFDRIHTRQIVVKPHYTMMHACRFFVVRCQCKSFFSSCMIETASNPY